MGTTFSHPFRFGTSGAVATVDDRSDAGIAQDIAALVLTHLGERVLAPSFGIPDPAFSDIEPSQLAAAMSVYGPDVPLRGIEVKGRTSSSLSIQITYDEEGAINA